MKDKSNQILNIAKYVLGLLGVGLCIWLIASDYPDSDAKLSEIDTYVTGIYKVEQDQESLYPLATKYVDTSSAKLDIIDTLDSNYKEIIEDYIIKEKTVEQISKKYKLKKDTVISRIARGKKIIDSTILDLVRTKETLFVKNWKNRKEQKIKDTEANLKSSKSKKDKEKFKNKLDHLKTPKVIKTGQKLRNGDEYLRADFRTIQKGDEIEIGKSYSFVAIDYVVYIIGLALIVVIIFFVYHLIIRTKKTALSILGLLISAAVFLILFFMGSSDTVADLQLDPEKVKKFGANTIDITSAGIYTVGICLFIGITSIIIGPFIGRYRK